MKVLVFTSLYPNNIWPNHGVFIKERMTQFAKLDGCEVRVVAPVAYFPPINVNWRWKFSQVARREFRDGIEVYHPRYIITPKIGMALYGWMMFFSVLPAVRKIQKTFDFDLIDAHYMYPDCFAAVLLGRSLRKPVVVSARGSDVNLFARFPIIRRLLKYTLLRADHVIAVSRALQQAIAQLGVSQQKVSVIPNGVEGGKFRRISKQKARQTLGLPVDCPVLLSVGGLTEVKGFDHLIRAFKTLVAESKEIEQQLLIVGEGASRNDLETVISELGLNANVHLVGAVPHEQLYLWYNAADLFCLASKREGWPNVILEALACGTPVVGAAVGGIPEIIVNEDIGLLTKREPAVMASRIREAMQKQWDRGKISRYAKGFTWNATAEKVHKVFDSVLSESELRSTGRQSREERLV